MKEFGFKLYKDPDLNYELVAGDLKVALNSVNKQQQIVTVYLGGIDDYDPATQKYIRTKLTLQDNDTLLWTLIKMADDGNGNQIEVPAVDFVKSVKVTGTNEDDVTELHPNNVVANFYYIDEDHKKLSTNDDNILWSNFNVGEYKYGWSTSTNEDAGHFRLAKRDPDDASKEIIMTRRDVYGDDDAHPDRFMLWSHGDKIPSGWYVKDFWAYTYVSDDNDDVKANDIIPRLRSMSTGVGNATRFDITFYIPANYTGSTQDIQFYFKIYGLKNVLVEKIDI